MIPCCVYLRRSGAVKPSLSLEKNTRCQNWSTIKSIHQPQRKYWKKWLERNKAPANGRSQCLIVKKSALLSAIKTSVVWRERRRIEPLTHESLAESAMRTERRANAHWHKRATVAAAWKRRLAQRPSQRGEIEGSIQKVGFRCKILISMRRRYRMLVHLLQEQWLTNSWIRGHT